ncbi:MAG: carboxypeptidase M32 [Pseudomonadota bacterium]
MSATEAYDALMAFTRQTAALEAVAGRLDWDQETMMPRGAAEQRGEEVAAMASVLHNRRQDPRVGEWLANAADAQGDPVGAANIREIRRAYERAGKVPEKLATELARVTSVAQGIWADARAAEDFAAFAPTLSQVVALKREEAQALAGDGPLYDALLNDYEAGMTGAEVEALFAALRPRLVALREAVLGAPDQPQPLSGSFDEAAQVALAEELATAFGYDFNHGRMDKAVHPFCSGGGADVRITTRSVPHDPFNCLYSTIHETGHAVYEQQVERAYAMTPIGGGVSLGVHESQSRIFENQLGRSRGFTAFLFERMRARFGDFGIADAEQFYRVVNRVAPGFIRTEADEVHYNLHILMRFDLERALLSGDLPVAELPLAWDSRFEADFGVAVDTPSNGCLQDVHWSIGLIGYFPTYTLGNVYAGCLFEAIEADVPDLEAQLRAGDTRAATGWLADALQRHGGLRTPRETIAHAIGRAPSEAPLLTYLDAKFHDLYGL